MTKNKDDAKKSSYKDHGTYYFNGSVEASTITPCIEWILDENVKMENQELTLIINSPGGYVTECFALLDIIKGSNLKVNTVGLGMIASCGLLMFLAGEKRILTPNTYVMAHQYSSGNYGKYHELLAGRKEEDWFHERLVQIFIEKLDMKRKKIEKLFFPASDVFMTAQEAKDYGIATDIRLL